MKILEFAAYVTALLSIYAPANSQDVGDGIATLMRIPLKRRLHPNDHLQQLLKPRVSRRTMEHNPAEYNTSVGPLVYNEVPLGVGYGTHYAELYLGIPPQRGSVIVDTGSHLTALPCSSCNNCGTHTDPLYDVSKSTTARYLTCKDTDMCMMCDDNQCHVSQSYTEGSMWNAIIVEDLAWVGDFKGNESEVLMKHYGVKFPVGCQTTETGLFLTQKENGIMGMGRHNATIMKYLLKNGRISNDIFSMCFGEKGGHMVLGGVDYSYHKVDQVSYTKLIPDLNGWYNVRLKDIQVAEKSIGINEEEYNKGKGVIVDSGTTDTFFVSSAAGAFAKAFQDVTGGIHFSNNDMELKEEQIAKFPNITLVLAGMNDSTPDITISVPPSKYLTKTRNGKYFGNIHFSERSGGVIGASSMIGLDVIFDVENERVGFVEAHCMAEGDSSTISDSNTSDFTKDTDKESSGVSTGLVVGVMAICMVGAAIATVMWRRMSKHSWIQIPGFGDLENESVLKSEADEGLEEEEEGHEAPTPRFTIGSDSDEDDEVEVIVNNQPLSPNNKCNKRPTSPNNKSNGRPTSPK